MWIEINEPGDIIFSISETGELLAFKFDEDGLPISGNATELYAEYEKIVKEKR